MAEREYAALRPPGAGIAVIDRGRATVVGLGSEWLDGPSVTPQTVFQVASLTKPFTAMLILRLAEQGRLKVDDPAASWLPWLPPTYRQVTIRQLLNHTSGVPRDLRRDNVDEFSLAEFQTRFLEAERSFAPGEKWEYSNTGYILLAMIAERAGRKPLDNLFEHLIFRPAGMRNTRYRGPLTKARGRATGYDWQDDRWVASPPVYSGYGNSGIESTAADLSAFATALQHRRLLRPSSYEAMLSKARLASGAPVSFSFRGAPTSYGLGWFLTDRCGSRVAMHGGTIAGFSSNLSWSVDRHVTAAVLSNGKSTADRIGLADKIAGAALNQILGC
jgi:CubicO group peptidase (beta-lactamase class C family)